MTNDSGKIGALNAGGLTSRAVVNIKR